LLDGGYFSKKYEFRYAKEINDMQLVRYKHTRIMRGDDGEGNRFTSEHKFDIDFIANTITSYDTYIERNLDLPKITLSNLSNYSSYFEEITSPEREMPE
jgi:hypothetical protein